MRRTVKRAFDVLLSALVLIVASPLFVAVSLGIWATMGRPVSPRAGRPGEQDVPIAEIPDDDAGIRQVRCAAPRRQRLTGFGSFLRRWSLDESPQLVNVLAGSMSNATTDIAKSYVKAKL